MKERLGSTPNRCGGLRLYIGAGLFAIGSLLSLKAADTVLELGDKGEALEEARGTYYDHTDQQPVSQAYYEYVKAEYGQTAALLATRHDLFVPPETGDTLAAGCKAHSPLKSTNLVIAECDDLGASLDGYNEASDDFSEISTYIHERGDVLLIGTATTMAVGAALGASGLVASKEIQAELQAKTP